MTDSLETLIISDSAENTIKAFNRLSHNVPSIGILSRKKRILAFITVTNQTQTMIDDHDISEPEALFVLSLMVRKHHDFQKASTIVALNLPKLGRAPFNSLGFKFANEIRKNLKLDPIAEMSIIS